MDSLRRKDSQHLSKNSPERLVFQEAKKPKSATMYISRQESQQLDEKYINKINQKERIRKIFLFIFVLLILPLISYLGYFSWKAISITNKMRGSQNSQSSTLVQDVRAIISPIVPAAAQPLKGEADGRINILLLGAAGEKNAGAGLTDTVMIMSVDTKNKKVALLSLPRDLYVNIPETQTFTKINSLYKIGLSQNLGTEIIKKAVEKITGLTINYYLVVNFDGFTKIINDIGGINIVSPRDLYDTTYPGPNYSYETFSLSKGFHTLNGKVALQYVRERHSDPEGDFGRAKRQQQVIQAVKSKMFSMETFFNVGRLNDILTTLGDNIKTDISLEEIGSFVNLSKNVDTQNINNIVADAWKPDSLLKVSHVIVGDVAAFILVPRVGNYSEIKDVAQNIFNQAELKKRQQEIAGENASIEIFNQSSDNQLANKVKKLLTENLGLKNVRIVQEANNSTFLSQTTVYDNSNDLKIFTADELIKKLPAVLSTQNNSAINSKADFVITLGEDLVSAYKFETDSIEDYNKAQDSQANFDFLKENQN